jgi:hypothetical protein
MKCPQVTVLFADLKGSSMRFWLEQAEREMKELG